jgi:hypothetical protein
MPSPHRPSLLSFPIKAQNQGREGGVKEALEITRNAA